MKTLKIKKMYDFNLNDEKILEESFYSKDNNIIILTETGKPIYNT